MCISDCMVECMNMDCFSSSRGAMFTCIYRWDPRFWSIFVLESGMDRRIWKRGGLLGGSTAERVGARHNDSLEKCPS